MKIYQIWDVRIQGKCVKSFTLNDHILKVLPLKDRFVAASGSDIIIADLRSNEIQYQLKLHRKGVMGLCSNHSSTRLLSGGLDHSIKVFETREFSLVHQFKMKDSIMDLELSSDSQHLAVGLSTGSVVVKSFQGHLDVNNKSKELDKYQEFFQERQTTASASSKKAKPGTKEWFIRSSKENFLETGLTLQLEKKKKNSTYDRFLRKFNYQEALRIVLKENNGVHIASLLEELWKRDGLGEALNGCDHEFLIITLKWLTKFLDDPRVNTVVLHVLGIVTNRFETSFGLSHKLDIEWQRLNKKLERETSQQKRLLKLQGICHLLLTQKRLEKKNSYIL